MTTDRETRRSTSFSGIHHLALYTHDLDETLRFYRQVVGLDTSRVAGSPRGRHAFVHLERADSGRPGLHFWENTQLARADTADRLAAFSSGPGVLAHVALQVPTPAAADALRAGLEARGVAVVEFEELGTYAFADPNGIMVEIVASPPTDFRRASAGEGVVSG